MGWQLSGKGKLATWVASLCHHLHRDGGLATLDGTRLGLCLAPGANMEPAVSKPASPWPSSLAPPFPSLGPKSLGLQHCAPPSLNMTHSTSQLCGELLASMSCFQPLGASEPRNMIYMSRLGIWGEGTPFRTFEEFLHAIEKR